MAEGANQQPEKPKDGIMDKFKGLNFFPALSKAWEKAHDSKDKGWVEKIGIFFSTFWNEMKEVEEDKAEVTEETKKELAKGVEETMKDAEKATGLDETKVDKGDKEFHEEVTGMAVASEKELDEAHQASAISGIETLKAAVEGKGVKPLSLAQNLTLGGIGLMTLAKLKARYSTPEKFREALDRYSKISDNSNMPLKKLLSIKVLAIFKMQLDLKSELARGAANVLSLGMVEKSPTMKLLDSFSLSVTDGMKLANLKGPTIDDEAEVVNIMRNSFFPHTSVDKVTNVAHIINKLLVKKPDPVDTKDIADLVFNVEDADLERMIEILTGKKAKALAQQSELPKAA